MPPDHAVELLGDTMSDRVPVRLVAPQEHLRISRVRVIIETARRLSEALEGEDDPRQRPG